MSVNGTDVASNTRMVKIEEVGLFATFTFGFSDDISTLLAFLVNTFIISNCCFITSVSILFKTLFFFAGTTTWPVGTHRKPQSRERSWVGPEDPEGSSQGTVRDFPHMRIES